VRRTIMLAFPPTTAGAALSSQTDGYGALMLGQLLIGTGCSPAFLVCTVFISSAAISRPSASRRSRAR